MNQQAIDQPARPRVLLVGDASARPTGLERALTRAGFHLIEQEEPGLSPEADAILITLADLDERPLGTLFPPAPGSDHLIPPRLVILSSADRDGPAAALALGAADALVAPIHLPELCARLHARIRQHHQATGTAEPAPVVATPTEPGSNGGDPQVGQDVSQPEEVSQALDRRVQEEFERARRYSLSFSLILLGIDGLRDSEERLIPEADELRHQVERTLRRELRVPDLVVPYGPEEFAILLPETGQVGARQSVIRVRERLTTLPFEGDPRLEPTRFCAGIVTYPHPAALQSDDLFAMAEAALVRGRAQAAERIGVAL